MLYAAGNAQGVKDIISGIKQFEKGDACTGLLLFDSVELEGLKDLPVDVLLLTDIDDVKGVDSTWGGGKTLQPKGYKRVHYLLRGEVYHAGDVTFLAYSGRFGILTNADRQYGCSRAESMVNARVNLAKAGGRVNFILSNGLPRWVLEHCYHKTGVALQGQTERHLEELMLTTDYGKWIAGRAERDDRLDTYRMDLVAQRTLSLC